MLRFIGAPTPYAVSAAVFRDKIIQDVIPIIRHLRNFAIKFYTSDYRWPSRNLTISACAI
jgi:hypothetical protein